MYKAGSQCNNVHVNYVTKVSFSIDLFTNTMAILNSIVSNSYYGMLRGQISMYLPPEHPIIIAICNNRI